MAEHLSNLVLDELAAGLAAPPGSQAHVDGCESCRTRLEAIARARAEAVASPRYHAIHAQLNSARPSARPWWLALLAPLAVAAVLALFVASPEEPGSTRTKGAATVRVLRGPDGESISAARIGERVVLAVGAAGRPYGLVAAIDAAGTVSVVWPARGRLSERVPPGAQARLEPGFEVTPGSTLLLAVFSETPIELESARRAIERSVEEVRKEGRSPLEVSPEPLPSETARAQALLVVEGSR
ncbi:MAG: hypothetical protein HYZ28_04325 [Myxococcales bacterium]|nr:hypothetical protein [Myxococcales bacterium]